MCDRTAVIRFDSGLANFKACARIATRARQDETRRLADRVLAKSKRKGRLGLIQPPGEGCTSFLIRGLSNFRARRFLPASLQIRNADAGTLRASNRTIGINRLFIAALTVGVATEDAQLADSK